MPRQSNSNLSEGVFVESCKRLFIKAVVLEEVRVGCRDCVISDASGFDEFLPLSLVLQRHEEVESMQVVAR